MKTLKWNERRAELIRKKHLGGGLTAPEELELERLQVRALESVADIDAQRLMDAKELEELIRHLTNRPARATEE